MSKALKNMTNEELWQLFPVIISEYKDEWKDYFAEEKSLLEHLLGDHALKIHHIGSTSVPGLAAKPTIDILIEIKDDTDTGKLIIELEKAGYIYSPQPDRPAPYMMFMKGYTQQGFADKVFHVHIRYAGDWDEIYFRDYLLSHPDEAQEYAHLKYCLKEKYEHDRDAYTNAKTTFITKIIKLAKVKD